MTGDPLVALSITGDVVGLLNFGITLLGRGYRIYNSPNCRDLLPLESRKSIAVLSALNSRLKRPLKTSIGCLTEDETSP
jgi:hypothetical protein